jgi:hypothetical protein
MRLGALHTAALLSFFVACHRTEKAAEPTAQTPSPSPAVGTVEQRLAVARSVRVNTAILGVEPGDGLNSAHQKLDQFGKFATPPKQDRETEREGENKILWELDKTDFRAVLIKTDEHDRITSVTAYLREDKMKSFNQIGDTKVAPVVSDTQVAWDIVRPERPHLRLVASGKDGKAAVIKVFIVKRARSQTLDPD